MPDADALLILATFLLAGMVKGVIGLGLPTVSLAILTIAFGLPTAMVLLLVPSFVTNLWQAAAGGHAWTLLQRLWPFLLGASLCVWIGAIALVHIDTRLLSALLGLLLTIYAGSSLAGLRLSVARRHERWAGPSSGIINGLLTGMTGSFVVPGVMYLNALGLQRNQLVQAMGMLFTLSTLALALALGGQRMLDALQLVDSAMALLPALIGMMLGQRFRRRLSEASFRRLFFFSLLLLGAYIIFAATRSLA
jgi:uncharacterized membrane protein YfcA